MQFHTPSDHPQAPAHTHGVQTSGPLLFVSGQVPKLPDGTTVSSDPVEQLRTTFRNVANVLSSVGATLSDVVHLRVYLSDHAHKAAFSQVRGEVFGDHKPALTVVICGIWNEEWVVEIEAVAEIPA